MNGINRQRELESKVFIKMFMASAESKMMFHFRFRYYRRKELGTQINLNSI